MAKRVTARDRSPKHVSRARADDRVERGQGDETFLDRILNWVDHVRRQVENNRSQVLTWAVLGIALILLLGLVHPALPFLLILPIPLLWHRWRG